MFIQAIGSLKNFVSSEKVVALEGYYYMIRCIKLAEKHDSSSSNREKTPVLCAP